MSKNFEHPTLGSGGKIGLKTYHMKKDRQTDGHRDSMKESAKGRFFENVEQKHESKITFKHFCFEVV